MNKKGRRVFRCEKMTLDPSTATRVQMSWLVEKGRNEVLVITRGKEHSLANHDGEEIPIPAPAAQQLHFQSSHQCEYLEYPIGGDGWEGLYRSYLGRLAGTYRFVLVKGSGGPANLGRELTHLDLETSLAPIKSTLNTRFRG